MTGKTSSKFISFCEVKIYLEKGHSVVIYQHLVRNLGDICSQQKHWIAKIHEQINVDKQLVISLYSGKGSGRFYFIICRDADHKNKIEKVLDNIEIKKTPEHGTIKKLSKENLLFCFNS